MLCNCKDCKDERRKTQMLKDHRLFSNNKSTATHWYPSNNRAPISIYALEINHLAAIVDQYESEVLKFFRELTGYPHPESFKTSFIAQGFLEKHVPAWKAIKQRQTNIQKNLPNIYRKFFIEKKYNEKKITKTTHGGGTKTEISQTGSFQIPLIDYRKFTNVNEPFPKYVTRKLSSEKKAQLNLKVVEAKVKVSNAFADLQEWIDKNL